MALTPFVLHGVSIGTVHLGGILEQESDLRNEVRAEITDGLPYPSFISIVGQKPRWTFGTRAIDTALAAAPAYGTKIGALTGGLVAWWQAVSEGGMRASGAVHTKYAMAKGVLVPARLACEAHQDAKLDYEATLTTDDATAPIVQTDNVSLPALVGAANRFTIGKITVGGIAITGATGLDIDFGLTVPTLLDGVTARVWDEYAWIEQMIPKVTIRGYGKAWLGDAVIPMLGKAATHVNTIIFLRKRASAATFIADNVANHVKITVAGMATIDRIQGAAGLRPGETALSITTVYDGANLPIVVTPNQAIT
jgi:hypothetical protein